MPDDKLTKMAVLYARVSTQEQARTGMSLDAQVSAMRAYCAMRGLEVTHVVLDPAVSAAKELRLRPGGARVVNLVAGDDVGHVVAFKLDRLFRNCRDCLAVTATWDKLGTSLHLVDLGGQSIDTSSAIGRFFLTVIAGAAEFERNLIAERTTAALAHRRAVGRRVGQIPYGYRLASDGYSLTPDADEQKALSTIRRLRREGMALRRIVDILNEGDAEPRGTKWHMTTVARLARQMLSSDAAA